MRPGEEDPSRLLDQIDGLLLTGGGDVDPTLYGGSAATAKLVDRQRDDFEIALIAGALERDLPILGICRGVQILNVECGGTLRSLQVDPQLSKRHGIGRSSFDAHEVVIPADSRLAELEGAAPVASTRSTTGLWIALAKVCAWWARLRMVSSRLSRNPTRRWLSRRNGTLKCHRRG